MDNDESDGFTQVTSKNTPKSNHQVRETSGDPIRGGSVSRGQSHPPPDNRVTANTLPNVATAAPANPPPVKTFGFGFNAQDSLPLKQPLNSKTGPSSNPQQPPRSKSKSYVKALQSASDSDAEACMSSSLLNLPPIFPPDQTRASFVLIIKPPLRDPATPKKLIIIDGSDAIEKEIFELIKTAAPKDIVTNAWSHGVMFSIDPYPVPPGHKDSLISTIFEATFALNGSSATLLSQMQDVISILHSLPQHQIVLTVRTRLPTSSSKQYNDEAMECDILFCKDFESVLAFSQRDSSPFFQFSRRDTHSPSYQLSISLPANCPQDYCCKVLCSLASFILNRSVPPEEIKNINASIFTRQKISTFNVGGAPKLQNSWRHSLTLTNDPTTEMIHSFKACCSLHFQHKSKTLDDDSPPHLRIKSCSFSFATEKLRPNPSKFAPIQWAEDIFEKLHHPNSDSIDTPVRPAASLPQSEQRIYLEQRASLLGSNIEIHAPFQDGIETIHMREFNFGSTPESMPIRPYSYFDLPLCLASISNIDEQNFIDYWLDRENNLKQIHSLFAASSTIRTLWHSFFPDHPAPTESDAWSSEACAHSFLSKIICAPFETRCHPIFILFDDSENLFIDPGGVANKIKCLFVPSACERQLQSSPAFLLCRRSHFTVLVPRNNPQRAFDILLSSADSYSTISYPSHLPDNPLSNLVSHSRPCLLRKELYEDHAIMMDAISLFNSTTPDTTSNTLSIVTPYESIAYQLLSFIPYNKKRTTLLHCLSHIICVEPDDMIRYFNDRAAAIKSAAARASCSLPLIDEWKVFTASNPHWLPFRPLDQALSPHLDAQNFTLSHEPRFLHILPLSPIEIKHISILCIEDNSTDSIITITANTPSTFIRALPSELSTSLRTAIILFRSNTFSLLTHAENTAHSLLRALPNCLIINPPSPLPFNIASTPFTDLITTSTSIKSPSDLATKHQFCLSKMTVAPLPDQPKPSAISSKKFQVKIDLSTYDFIRLDYGQHINYMEKTFPNACFLLCLATAADVNITQLARYFLARKDMLIEANTFMESHEQSQDLWRSFTQKHFNHLAGSFPSAHCWAGEFFLGNTVDLQHLILLSPTEIRNTPLLFIHNEDPKETYDSPSSSATLTLAGIGNKLAYFPALDPKDAHPPCIILHRSSHYTILHPSDHLTFNTLAAHVPAQNIQHYIQRIDTPLNPFIALIGLHTPCSHLGQLFTEHKALLQNSLLPAEWMPYISPQHSLDGGAAQPSNTHSPSICVIHDTPSPHPGDKRTMSLSTPEAQHDSLRDNSRNKPSTSPADQLLTMSLSSGSSSITSSTDLGNLVKMKGSKTESKYRASIGVRAQTSPDESSEATDVSDYVSDASSSTSDTPSIFSVGSFHHHAVRPGFELPTCKKCRRPFQFGCFHNDNHTCDGSECVLFGSPMNAGNWGWHCAHCSIDLCTACERIDWIPYSSMSSREYDPSDIPDSFDTQRSIPSSQNLDPPQASLITDFPPDATVGSAHGVGHND